MKHRNHLCKFSNMHVHLCNSMKHSTNFIILLLIKQTSLATCPFSKPYSPSTKITTLPFYSLILKLLFFLLKSRFLNRNIDRIFKFWNMKLVPSPNLGTIDNHLFFLPWSTISHSLLTVTLSPMLISLEYILHYILNLRLREMKWKVKWYDSVFFF